MASYGSVVGSGGTTVSGSPSSGQVATLTSATDITGSALFTYATGTGLAVIVTDDLDVNTNVVTITHRDTSGGGHATTMGAGIAFAVESTTASTDHTIAEVYSVATTNTTGGVTSNLVFRTRSSGAALATAFTIGAGALGNATLAGGAFVASGGSGAFLATNAASWLSLGAAAATSQKIGLTGLVAAVPNAAGSVLDYIDVNALTQTFTGTTQITTAAGVNLVNISAPTYSCASAMTVDRGATLYISGAPIGGGAGPITLTSGAALKTGSGSVVVGGAAIATNATAGFLYLPTCAGTPTGVPEVHTGTCAMVFDTTNNKLYIYDGGWLGGTAPGAWTA